MKSKIIRIGLILCVAILALEFGGSTLLKAFSNKNSPVSAPSFYIHAPEENTVFLPPSSEMEKTVEPADKVATTPAPLETKVKTGAREARLHEKPLLPKKPQNVAVFPENESLFPSSETESSSSNETPGFVVRNEYLSPLVGGFSGPVSSPEGNKSAQRQDNPAGDNPAKETPTENNPVEDNKPAGDNPVEDNHFVDPLPDFTEPKSKDELPGTPGDGNNGNGPSAPSSPSFNGGDSNPKTSAVPDAGLTAILLGLGVAGLACAKRRQAK